MANEDAVFPEVEVPMPAEMLGYDEEVIATGQVIQEGGNNFFVSDKVDTSDDRFRHAAYVRVAQGTYNVRAVNIAPETQRIQLEF
jgi:hypothetical protein